MITIRPYTEEDYEWTVETASYKSVVEEAKRPELVNKEQWYKVAKLIYDMGVGFIAEEDGNRIGMIGAVITKHIFNPAVTTSNVITWYILPEYRKSRAGYLLLKEMEKASALAADYMAFSLLSTESVKPSTLEKKGFHMQEIVYSKQLEVMDDGS